MQNTKLIKKISTSLVSTGEIIDSLQSNSSTSAPSIRAVVDNMTPPMNLLINGDFKIWQRGDNFTIEGDEAFHYTADMWCVYASTGQTIKVDKITDGLQFSGTAAIMQRMNPLEVGKNYTFLCRVDGDVKTLPIVGGTYTENSFLKYNKSGSYEQLQIKSNGITNIADARLWEGNTIYKLIKEDDAIALMRCQEWVYGLITGDYARLPLGHLSSDMIQIPLPFINLKSYATVIMDGNFDVRCVYPNWWNIAYRGSITGAVFRYTSKMFQFPKPSLSGTPDSGQVFSIESQPGARIIITCEPL